MRRFFAAFLAAWLYLSAGPATAQLLLTGVSGNNTVSSGFSVTYSNSNDSTPPAVTTFTTTAIGVGTAGTHRLIVVAVSLLLASGGAISDLQIGGVNMNPVVTDAAGQTRIFGIYELVVTTGSTVQVKVDTTQNMQRASFDVWTVQNATGDAHSAVSNSGTTNTGPSTAVTISSIAIPASTGVAVCGARFSSNRSTVSWTGTGTTSSNHANGTTIQMSAYTDATVPGTSPSYIATGFAGSLARGGCASYGP